jgi:Fe-S-cluster containining protein
MKGEPATDRSCGTCTACCKWYEVKEIKKPEKEWCTHCDIGKGCRIYPDHPKACQEFLCMWRAGGGGESDRPDRSQLILDEFDLGASFGYEIVGYGLVVTEMRDGAVEKSALFAKAKRAALCAGSSIWIRRHRANDELYLAESLAISDAFIQKLLDARIRVFRYRSAMPIIELGG